MGGCHARDRDIANQVGGKVFQTRPPELSSPSPRDVRFDLPIKEQRPSVSSGDGGSPFEGASPRTWHWKGGFLRTPIRAKNGAGADTAVDYKPLALLEEESDAESEDRLVRKPSVSQVVWVETWLESVESGELDVYTCLGLSNAFTWSPDTRKLAAKVFAVTTLQIVIPCIMLYLETVEGLTLDPAEEGKGFRLIGSALYLYSVYSMYNNALDECRSRLLNFAFTYNLPAGYWAPLVLGEVSNVLVSFVLVITLYIIYTHLTVPADLILNAVAVNFLGSVDAEFVSEDMKKDALANFREITTAILQNPTVNTQTDDDDEAEKDTVVDRIVKSMLYCIVLAGVCFSVVFFFAPTAKEQKAGGTQGKGHIGCS